MDRNKTIVGVGAVLDAVSEIVGYSIQKAAFEADERIRAEIEHCRAALFSADSAKSRVVTTELAIVKTKCKLLQQKVLLLREEIRPVFNPLMDELLSRIEELREHRW